MGDEPMGDMSDEPIDDDDMSDEPMVDMGDDDMSDEDDDELTSLLASIFNNEMIIWSAMI